MASTMSTLTRTFTVMGFRAVGKTALCSRYIDGHFEDRYCPTIINTFQQTINVNQKEYDLNLLDTAGQDEYSLLEAYHTLGSHGYIIMYDITKRSSFEVAQIVYEKIYDNVGKIRVPVILVGNKKDLEEQRVITEEEGLMLAKTWNGAFLEISAKNNELVSNVFKSIVMEVEKFNNLDSGANECIIA